MVVLLALLAVPFFVGLGRWPLIEPDEGRNAEVAREMLATGDWVVPRFDGLPFLDKPAGLFWAIGAAFRVAGVDELAARLPSAASAVALILLGFAIARMLLGRRRALLAATVIATSPLVFIFGRLVIFDMLFTALVTMAVACLLRDRIGKPSAVWLPLAALAMALATLTKGPVGVALPVLAWLAARGALPQGGSPRPRLALPAAILVFTALVSPWLAAVVTREPAFLSYALFDETLLRFTSAARFNRGGPPWYPLMVLALGCGVWLAVLAAVTPVLVRRARSSSRDAVAIRFAARAAATILLFFTVCASKRPGYLLPAFVPLSILVAAGVSAERARAAAALGVVGFAAVIAGTVTTFAALASAAWPPPLPLGEATAALTRPTVLVAGVVLLAWGLATAVAFRGRPLVRLALGALMTPVMYLALLGPLTAYAEYRSAREIARRIEPEAQVIAFQTFRTSLPFYLGHAVVLASRTGGELTSNYVKTQWPRFVDQGIAIRPGSVSRQLHDPSRTVVLASRHAGPLAARDLALVAVAADAHSVVLESPGSVRESRDAAGEIMHGTHARPDALHVADAGSRG